LGFLGVACPEDSPAEAFLVHHELICACQRFDEVILQARNLPSSIVFANASTAAPEKGNTR
jgi:hypothetical protein